MNEKYRPYLRKMSKEELIKCAVKPYKTSPRRFQDLKVEDYDHNDIMDIGGFLLRWFKYKHLGNPFNYNRFFEFMQSKWLGYTLLGVGGGSDAIDDIKGTTELKATKYLGTKVKGDEKSHSFSYNGTSFFKDLTRQRNYCYNKIMRDKWHHWSIYDEHKGTLIKTIKLTNEQVWEVLWPKWKKSWDNAASAFRGEKENADPRIGATISTNELKKAGIKYEVIYH